MLLRLPNIKFLISTLGENGCMMLERSIKEAPEEEETDVETLVESLKQKIDQNSTRPICIASKGSSDSPKRRDLASFSSVSSGTFCQSGKVFGDNTFFFLRAPSPDKTSNSTSLPTPKGEASGLEATSIKERKRKALRRKSERSSLRLNADGIGAISGRLLIGTAEVIPPLEIIDTTGAGDAFIGAVLYGCAGMPPERMLPFASTVAATICRALGAWSGLPLRTDPRLTPFWW